MVLSQSLGYLSIEFKTSKHESFLTAKFVVRIHLNKQAFESKKLSEG